MERYLYIFIILVIFLCICLVCNGCMKIYDGFSVGNDVIGNVSSGINISKELTLTYDPSCDGVKPSPSPPPPPPPPPPAPSIPADLNKKRFYVQIINKTSKDCYAILSNFENTTEINGDNITNCNNIFPTGNKPGSCNDYIYYKITSLSSIILLQNGEIKSGKIYLIPVDNVDVTNMGGMIGGMNGFEFNYQQDMDCSPKYTIFFNITGVEGVNYNINSYYYTYDNKYELQKKINYNPEKPSDILLYGNGNITGNIDDAGALIKQFNIKGILSDKWEKYSNGNNKIDARKKVDEIDLFGCPYPGNIMKHKCRLKFAELREKPNTYCNWIHKYGDIYCWAYDEFECIDPDTLEYNFDKKQFKIMDGPLKKNCGYFNNIKEKTEYIAQNPNGYARTWPVFNDGSIPDITDTDKSCGNKSYPTIDQNQFGQYWYAVPKNDDNKDTLENRGNMCWSCPDSQEPCKQFSNVKISQDGSTLNWPNVQNGMIMKCNSTGDNPTLIDSFNDNNIRRTSGCIDSGSLNSFYCVNNGLLQIEFSDISWLNEIEESKFKFIIESNKSL